MLGHEGVLVEMKVWLRVIERPLQGGETFRNPHSSLTYNSLEQWQVNFESDLNLLGRTPPPGRGLSLIPGPGVGRAGTRHASKLEPVKTNESLRDIKH